MAHTQASSTYHDSDDDDLPTLDVLLARLPGRNTQLQPSRSKTALYPESTKITIIDLGEEDDEDDAPAVRQINRKPDLPVASTDRVREELTANWAKEGILERWWPSQKKIEDDSDDQDVVTRRRRRIVDGQESRQQESRLRPHTAEKSTGSTRSTKEPQVSTRRPRSPSEQGDKAPTSSSSTSSDTSLRSRRLQLLAIELSDSGDEEEPAARPRRSAPTKGSRNTKYGHRPQSPAHEHGKEVIRPFSRLSINQLDLLGENSSQPGDPTSSCPIPPPKENKHQPTEKLRSADIARLLESDDEWDEPPVVSETNTTQISPSKSSPSKKQIKKSFESKKSQLATDFLGQLDTRITHGKIWELTESTGGVKIVWSNTLKTTAGRANWKREAVISKQTDVKQYRHHSSIELSEKVIDDEQRLLNVIAHEFCHLANFMINGITDNPHGKEFKVWAAKCSQVFGSQGIKVTTKHSYEIDFKYVWACTACACEYKRHSKSIDPKRHRCGACKAMLEQTKPTPRQTPSTGQLSGYQLFVKEQMKLVKSENPNSPQKEIMRIIAEKWAKAKS